MSQLSDLAQNRRDKPTKTKMQLITTTCLVMVVSLRDLRASLKVVFPPVGLVEAHEALQITKQYSKNSKKTRTISGRKFKIGVVKILMTGTDSQNISMVSSKATWTELVTFSSSLIPKTLSKAKVTSLLSSNSLRKKRRRNFQMNCSNSKSSNLKTVID